MSTHKYDDNAWERDLQKEFICQHHIPSEKNLIKESEALFAYITESDQKKLMSVSSNYLKFARAKRKELYPPNHPANRIIEIGIKAEKPRRNFYLVNGKTIMIVLSLNMLQKNMRTSMME